MGDFRPIPNTSGLYQISANGIVVSRRRPSMPNGYWLVISISKSKNARPFQRVGLYFDGDTKPKMCQVSRLILEAWVGPPPTDRHVAAHKNGVPDDDRLENLKWSLMKDVKQGQICRGTWVHGDRVGSARLSREQVEAARKIVTDHGVPANLLATALGTPQARVREWLTTTWDADKWSGLENPLEAE